MPLSGKEMLRIYIKNGWTKVSQRGSHVKVEKGKHIEIIPMHKELKRGLESKLLKRIKKES
jgi:predicted RNA binding protein YcfA (HicA-like mRNA interferase family)